MTLGIVDSTPTGLRRRSLHPGAPGFTRVSLHRFHEPEIDVTDEEAQKPLNPRGKPVRLNQPVQ
jgi:hypothetical protein